MTKSSPKMPSTKEWKNSFLAKQGDSYFVSLPNDARADTIIIILNHMSSCDVFIRKLEYRVAEFGDEWEDEFEKMIDYIKETPELAKQLKCVNIKLGKNCDRDQDTSYMHHSILKVLKKSIITGEAYANKDYKQNEIRLVISERNCPNFLQWLRSYLIEYNVRRLDEATQQKFAEILKIIEVQSHSKNPSSLFDILNNKKPVSKFVHHNHG